MEHIIKKGSPEWRELFYDNDTAAFWGESEKIDTLYARGDLSALLDESRPKVIVTGTRDPKDADMYAVQQVMRALAANPYRPVVLSGLAIGTDTQVNSIALRYGIPTVAVLPCWLGNIYPFANKTLAERIASTPECALLSQFPEGTLPDATKMISRNKTMAMIADTAVITSAKKVGSPYIVGRLMFQRGRVCYAVPGRPGEINSEGCNYLIKEGVCRILPDFEELEDIYVMRKSNEYKE